MNPMPKQTNHIVSVSVITVLTLLDVLQVENEVLVGRVQGHFLGQGSRHEDVDAGLEDGLIFRSGHFGEGVNILLELSAFNIFSSQKIKKNLSQVKYEVFLLIECLRIKIFRKAIIFFKKF